jgi:outer membrane protein
MCYDPLTTNRESCNVRRTMRKRFLSCIAIASCGALTAVAQNGAATKTVSLSLHEALSRALQQNYSIKLGYFTPQTARLQLEEIYGAYDPVFTASATHNYVQAPGTYDVVRQESLSGNQTWQQVYSGGFEGLLPSGTRYELTSSLDRLQLEDETFNDYPAIYGSRARVSVTQPLLKDFWFDGTRANAQIGKIEIKRADLGLQYTIMGVVRDTTKAYYDLIEARDQVKVREMALQLKEQFLAETKKKVAAGTLASLDEKQAESEAAAARTDLIQARSTAEQAENLLKGLLFSDFSSVHTTTLEPSEKLLAMSQQINVVESWRTGLEQRPDFLSRKHLIEQEKIQLKYRKNQLYPSLDLVASYARYGNQQAPDAYTSLDAIGDNISPRYSGGIVLTLPLSRKSERAAHKRQKIAVETALLELKQAEEDIIRTIDTEAKKVRSAFAAIESSREARVFAEAALDAEQKKLENGKSTNFQVLELQDRLTQARAAEISAMTDYNKALQDFYYSEGTILQKNKVSVELK